MIEIYGIVYDGKTQRYISKQNYRNLMSDTLPKGWAIVHIPVEWEKDMPESEPTYSFWQDVVSAIYRWFD